MIFCEETFSKECIVLLGLQCYVLVSFHTDFITLYPSQGPVIISWGKWSKDYSCVTMSFTWSPPLFYRFIVFEWSPLISSQFSTVPPLSTLFAMTDPPIFSPWKPRDLPHLKKNSWHSPHEGDTIDWFPNKDGKAVMMVSSPQWF